MNESSLKMSASRPEKGNVKTTRGIFHHPRWQESHLKLAFHWDQELTPIAKEGIALFLELVLATK